MTVSSWLDELEPLVVRLIPADTSPDGWRGGVREYLATYLPSHLAEAIPPLRRLVEALRTHPSSGERDWDAFLSRPNARADVLVLTRLCFEGYYGGTMVNPPAGWATVGYDPWPAGTAVSPSTGVPAGVDDVAAHYDVVIVGSGPGGAAAARVLSASGARVLVLERGDAKRDSELRGDHIRGKRMALFAPTLGAGTGNPRVVTEPDGRVWTADGEDSADAWGLNALTLGGGTRVWQGMAWRFLPEDFRMATLYGVPEASSLTDWPITYDDLAPFYAQAEDELGVSGELGPLTARLPGHPGYRMPALPSDAVRVVLGDAAAARGWATGPIPFAINSIAGHGRPACIGCHQCMGHTCPVGAKNGAHNTFLATAVSTGRCDVLSGAQATRVVMNRGRASEVDMVVVDGAGLRSRSVRCDVVIVAAGAIETPRLLMASGIGNDWVGRNLQGHAVSLVVGRSPTPVPVFRGPGHSVATMQFVHGGGAPYGGGVLFDSFAPYPLQLATWAERLGGPPSGLGHKAWMRGAVSRTIGAMTMGQELPLPLSRVSLEPGVVDAAGVPAVRLHRAEHPETVRIRTFLAAACREWLTEAGCEAPVDLFAASDLPARRSPATEHSAGTVRMGDDPSTSAASADGLVWGTENVYVSDGSLLPTNGSVNPTLTMTANALRVADGVARVAL